jgi:plastocyanin domain-containing protein
MKTRMKNVVQIGALLLVLIFMIFGAINTSASRSSSGIAAANFKGDVQEVNLKFENYNYKLVPDNLIKDVPVRMTVEMDTVFGCMRDIRIPAFGVSKYVTDSDNIIEFVPDKSGSFNIACSMNMGRGSFTVSNGDGKVSDYVDTSLAGASASGGSCGSGGGCGCGGA